MIRTSSDGTSATFSTVRGLSLVCSFLICLIRFEIDVGRLAEAGACLVINELAACGWSDTGPSTDCEPDGVSPWFQIWDCWAGAEWGIGACGCGLLEGAVLCFSYTVFQ
jgi:hypothetical protein